MATTYGMGGGTPVMSTVMPPPSGMGGMTTPMTTPMTTQNMGSINTGGFTRNMSLPLASNLPINVDENTPNLEEIQGFPVAGRSLDGAHFHQDPVTGQIYRMTDELHARIPEILANRISSLNLKITIPTKNGNKEYKLEDIYKQFMVYVKNNSELVSQFYKSSRLDYLKNVERENINLKIDTTRINDEFYYTDNIDVVNNDIVLYDDGTYKILGPSGVVRNDINKYNSIDGKINIPINNFSNMSQITMQKLILRKYTPVTKLLNPTENLISTIGVSTKYTPINKFYNSR